MLGALLHLLHGFVDFLLRPFLGFHAFFQLLLFDGCSGCSGSGNLRATPGKQRRNGHDGKQSHLRPHLGKAPWNSTQTRETW